MANSKDDDAFRRFVSKALPGLQEPTIEEQMAADLEEITPEVLQQKSDEFDVFFDAAVDAAQNNLYSAVMVLTALDDFMPEDVMVHLKAIKVLMKGYVEGDYTPPFEEKDDDSD